MLGCAVLLALSARGPLLFQNYPYLNFVDEGYVIRQAMNMYREGSPRPLSFHYNPVLQEIIAIGAWVRGQDPETVKLYWTPGLTGDYANSDFEKHYGSIDPPDFIAIARIVVLAFFVASVACVWIVIARFLPPPFAALGALVHATTPVFLKHSVYAENDVPIMAVGTMLLLVSLNISRGRLQVLVSAALIGLATGMKTTGILLAALPAIFLLFERRFRDIALLALSSVAFFYLFSPGMLGEERGLVQNLLQQNEFTSSQASGPSYLVQLLSPSTIAPLLVLCALLGAYFGISARDKRQQQLSIACASMAVGYLAFFLPFAFQPTRYIFPILPYLVVLAIFALHRICSYRFGVAIACLLACAVIGQQTYFSYLDFVKLNRRVDSRIVVADWLEVNASRGERIAIWDAIVFSPAEMRKLEVDLAVDFIRFEDALPSHEVDLVVHGEARQGDQVVFEVGRKPINPSPFVFPAANRKIVVSRPRAE